MFQTTVLTEGAKCSGTDCLRLGSFAFNYYTIVIRSHFHYIIFVLFFYSEFVSVEHCIVLA